MTIQIKRPHCWLILGAVTCCGSYAFALGVGTRLIINGKVASARLRTIGGQAYVPVADVARALQMVVETRSDGLEMKLAGGANPVEGLRGKIGDLLFDGRWRFSVLSVKEVESYTMRTPDVTLADEDAVSVQRDTMVVTPKRGYGLILVDCHVVNGRKMDSRLWVGSDVHNAIADTDGEAFRPVGYDFAGAPVQTKFLIPGSKVDFPILFAIPVGKTLQDLVFTLVANGDFEHKADVRVNLGGLTVQP